VVTDGARNMIGRNLDVACIDAEMEYLNSNPLPNADPLHHAPASIM
jgi:hypothetical protein